MSYKLIPENVMLVRTFELIFYPATLEIDCRIKLIRNFKIASSKNIPVSFVRFIEIIIMRTKKKLVFRCPDHFAKMITYILVPATSKDKISIQRFADL